MDAAKARKERGGRRPAAQALAQEQRPQLFAQAAGEEPEKVPVPAKFNVKKELVEEDAPASKRPRRQDGEPRMPPPRAPLAPLQAPSPARANAVGRSPPRKQARLGNRDVAELPLSGRIAWALSHIRGDLDALREVEGISALLATLPYCVLVGSIAARRELVAAMLGEHAHASAAAAALVAPGMRQPVAVEIRAAQETSTEKDADAWLQNVTAHLQKAMGARLRAEPIRLRLSAPGGADLDLLELPDRTTGGGPNHKLEEVRAQHLGSAANLLVCLEPGAPLENCRRFDPQLKRTVLLGAASSDDVSSGASAAQICGPDAARKLQAHFNTLCSDRLPKLQERLGLLEVKFTGTQREAKAVVSNEGVEGTVARARAVGLSFGRALQTVIGGTPGCSAGALTLEAELVEFAAAGEKGSAAVGRVLSAKSAATAIQDAWKGFEGGVRGYATYLQDEVRAAGADVALNGGAAWQRLLVEIEVAMRLAFPPQEELSALAIAAVQAGGTSAYGPQRWDDVASKLLMSMAFDPLIKRIQYIAARVAWVLRQQKAAVAEWMATLADGPVNRLHSPLFPQHLEILRSSPLTRDLVFKAFDRAADTAAARLLENLESTLTAGCINPGTIMRPFTKPSVSMEAAPAAGKAAPAGSGPGRAPSKARGAESTKRSEACRRRVAAEMQRRSGRSGGLMSGMHDRTFQPKQAKELLPQVEQELRRAFGRLANTLANQAVAFADTSLAALCRREIEECMAEISLDADQERAIAARHAELQQKAELVDFQLTSVRRCIDSCRSVQQAATGSSVRAGAAPRKYF